MYQIAILTLLFISWCRSVEYEISLTSSSLHNDKWVNEGTLSSTGDINSFPGGTVTTSDGLQSLCFDKSGELTYINYNTNSAINPKLTMEIWINPTITPTGKDWLLGHDNGGFDRTIIIYDTRFNGIAAGVGNSYKSTISYPALYEWTQIIATFDSITKKATIYKNGGSANGGEQQTVDIVGDSGGEPNIGLNGLKNFGDHNFVGCIGQVQIVNDVISAAEINALYAKFVRTIGNAERTQRGSFQLSYTCKSLENTAWINKGTLSGTDITTITGNMESNIDGITSLCFDPTDAITYIDYNTNSYLDPQLTMEVWIYPTITPSGKDWLLGHDNGGFDRTIIVYDDRFNGIAAGVGYTYQSTVSYPTINKWTQIIVTFNAETNKATIYKNTINGGEEQTVDIGADSGGETNIGLNGLKNFADHTFGGCIGQIQITNRILSNREIKGLSRKFKKTVRNGCGFRDDEMSYYAAFNGFGLENNNIFDNKWTMILCLTVIIICGLIVNRFYVKKKDVNQVYDNEKSPLLINVPSNS